MNKPTETAALTIAEWIDECRKNPQKTMEQIAEAAAVYLSDIEAADVDKLRAELGAAIARARTAEADAELWQIQVDAFKGQVSTLTRALEAVEKYVAERRDGYRNLLNTGKGEHGTPGYVRDETWASWNGKAVLADDILVFVTQEADRASEALNTSSDGSAVSTLLKSAAPPSPPRTTPMTDTAALRALIERLRKAAQIRAREWSHDAKPEDCIEWEAADALASLLDAEPVAPFEFDRYINGVLMAEGVTIEKQDTLEGAMKVAARIASRGPNGEAPVLVYRTPVPAEAPAGWREVLDKEEAALRKYLEEHCQGDSPIKRHAWIVADARLAEVGVLRRLLDRAAPGTPEDAQ